MHTAHIIGGGLGGLSAAIHSQLGGNATTLLEKNEQVGGKCNRTQWQDHTFDTGPSLLTMPFILQDLFTRAGRNLDDYVTLERVTPACRYFFPDGIQFDARGSIDGFRDEVKNVFPGEEAGFDSFIKYCRKLWEVSGPMFLFNPLEVSSLLKINPLKALAGLSALKPWTLHQSLQHFFKHPHLIQIFSRYATYNGSDPYRCPATFNVIAYIEMQYGSWHCRGGMYALVQALARLATELGVDIRCNSEVTELGFSAKGKRIAALTLRDGAEMQAEQVIVNADAISALAGPLFSQHPQSNKWQQRFKAREVSGSGFVELMALDRTFDELAVHNIFFCPDYPREFKQIFHAPCALTEPTLYVSRPCAMDPTQAPAGQESWFVLVNAPSLDRFNSWPGDYGEHIKNMLIKRVPGLQAEHMIWQQSLPPTFLQSRYHAWQGSIYGLSSNRIHNAFFRVRNRSAMQGVAFAGGSAHPGGGIPLVLLSGKLAAEALARCNGKPN